MFQKGVGGENTVVRLHNGCGDLWGRVDCEAKLGLLAVVNRQTLQKEGTQTRTSASTHCIEDKEALESCAIVSELSDAVQT